MTGRLSGNILNTNDGYKFYRQKSNVLKSKLYFRCTHYRSGCTAIIHTAYRSNNAIPKDLKIIYRAGSHNHSPQIYSKKKKEDGERLLDEDDKLNSELDTDSEDNETMEDEETGGTDDEDGDESIDYDDEDGEQDEDDDEDDNFSDEENDGNTASDGLMVLYYLQFLNYLEDNQLKQILERLTPIELGSIRIAFNCYMENQDKNFNMDNHLVLNLQSELNNVSYFIDGEFSHEHSIDFLKSGKFFDAFKQILSNLCCMPSIVLSAVLDCA